MEECLNSQDDVVEGLDEGESTNRVGGKIVLEKADRSLSEFCRWHKQGRIIVDPEWQRNYVWDCTRSSKLIESFLLDIPVPVVYLARRLDGKYEVIDGLQRLTSIFNFFDGKFRLQKLDFLNEDLDKKFFKELKDEYKNKLEDSILRSFEITSSSEDLHFTVFERLNTGGVRLNDMEIRNCIFRGNLNNLIKELAHNKDFITAVSQKGIESRMQDRTLILRYLAFIERTHHNCNKGLKQFLNRFLTTHRDANQNIIDEFRKSFEKSMKACLTVFGNSAFRLKSEITKPNSKSSGEWATRINAAIFQVVATSFARYDLAHITRAADSIYEEYLDLISTDTEWVDRVRRATGEATRLSYTFNTWYSRLESIMKSVPQNDGKRLFSRQLKKEMFDTNPTCSLCGQKISLIDDAVLDHDKQYWKGGLTVPENANLAHRLCNSIKN